LSRCSHEFTCDDREINTTLIGFTMTDVETLIFRRFKADDNFQTLVDSFTLIRNFRGYFTSSNDTILVASYDQQYRIIAGFDWQIHLPAKNKTISLSQIATEKRTSRCNTGLFNMGKVGCNCVNRIFSAKQDGVTVTFANSNTALNTIYIKNETTDLYELT
jgi:hypothetical protein